MKTKDFIEQLRQSIIDFEKFDDWNKFEMTKEDLLSELMMCEEVKDNLHVIELKLIWYLRNTDNFELHRFYRLAKENYENHQKIIALSHPQRKKLYN